MTVLTLDEVNRLNNSSTVEKPIKTRSMPIERYFGEMAISKPEIDERIQVASSIQDSLLAWFYAVWSLFSSDTLVSESDREFLTEMLFGKVGTRLGIDKVRQIADSTFRNIENDYFLSEDRARLIAEEEVNTIYNKKRHEENVERGFSRKRWHTVNDNRVRGSHREVEGQTIPIDEFFEVGDCLMLFPRDAENGSDREINGCRCWAEYLK